MLFLLYWRGEGKEDWEVAIIIIIIKNISNVNYLIQGKFADKKLGAYYFFNNSPLYHQLSTPQIKIKSVQKLLKKKPV